MKNKTNEENLSKQEYCSECGAESVIDTSKYEEQLCSECGEVIMPCSICRDNYECHKCTVKTRFKVDDDGHAVEVINGETTNKIYISKEEWDSTYKSRECPVCAGENIAFTNGCLECLDCGTQIFESEE